MAIDPVDLSSIWNRLIEINEELGVRVKFTSFTEQVREGVDFSISIYTTGGELVAQGTFAPGHLGALPIFVKEMLKLFPIDTWHPGDVVMCNSPWLNPGHLSDFSLLMPIFYGDTIPFFLAVTCHHVDVGGLRAGSQVVQGATELIQEGIHIPPIKVWKEYKVNEECLAIIGANVREPVKTLGDIRAQKNALESYGVQALRELLDRYGSETISNACQEIINHTEAEVREAISKLPDGSYSAEHWFDGYGPGTPPLKGKLTVIKKGDTLTLDFTGTDAQVPAGINSHLTFTRAYSMVAIKSLISPYSPQNEGGFRPLRFIVPEGCFLNATKDAPCGARSTLAKFPFELVMLALAQVKPEREMAGFGGVQHGSFGIVDPKTKRQFVGSEFIWGSCGGLHDRDGLDFISGVHNTKNIPMEIWEASYPLWIKRQQVVADSAGAGMYRGGAAFERETVFFGEKTYWAGLAEKERFPAYGLSGGKSGKPSKTILRRKNGEEVILGGMENAELEYGDSLILRVSGGGGVGDPLKRDPEAVLRDVKQGFVSMEGAASDYGVVLKAEQRGLEVAYEDTEKLRARMRNNDI